MPRDIERDPVSPLRRERELRGWSQAYVARAIGAPSHAHVSRWERGVVVPSPHYLERFCRLFGKSAEELGFIDPIALPAGRPPAAIEPIYRGLMGLDIEPGRSTGWTDPLRARLRERLHRVLDEALAQAGIDPSLTARGDTADGLWMLAAAELPTARLLDPLAAELVGGLERENVRAPAGGRMRLRLAVHAGEIIAGPHGGPGAGLVQVGRLLSAEATHAALAGTPGAPAVLLVSDGVYDEVVWQAPAGIDPSAWQPVRIHAGETTMRAWISLPGMEAQPRLPAVLVAPGLGPATLPVPRELPRPTADFTGRTGELAALRRLLDLDAGAGRGQRAVIVALDGMAGVGKSALAIHAAHQVAESDAFPDGQLYVNLQGAQPGLPPLAPLDALGRMLRSLGLDPAAIPTDIDEAAARFRSLAAERRLLVVLDNASSAEQIRPLLPGSPTCGVLMTSRQVLATLEGARALHLDVLPEDGALELLGRVAGRERIGAEPEAANDVVRCCGRLPLAIRIAGARLAARPRWPVRELAAHLADAARRLEELQAGELAVHASFEVSLQALEDGPDPVDRAAAAAFALLSLPDGPDLGVAAAARLVDLPETEAQALLERLVDARLLDSVRPDRYQFHDLVRLYARRHAGRRHTDAERQAALARVAGFYAAVAWRTLALVRPGNRRLAAADPRWARGGLEFDGAAAALDWLETERANVLAALAQVALATAGDSPAIPPELPGQLAQALFGFFAVRGHWHDGVRANQIALRVAERLGDRAAQASAHNDLGLAYARQGRYARAITHQRESLAVSRELGDRPAQAAVLSNLSLAYGETGGYPEALACLEESLSLQRETGDRQGNAATLMNFGSIYARLGRIDEAIGCLQESVGLFRALEDLQGQARSLSHLGLAHERLGHHAEAIACQQASLDICRELGNRDGEAESLNHLGAVFGRIGRFPEAIACQRDSLAIARALGARRLEAMALRDLGDALGAAGDEEQSRAAWRESLAIAEALRIPEASEIRTRLDSPPSTVLNR